MSKPDISVVIPTINRFDSLKNLLAALEEQSFSGQKEVIIVDDGSAPATSTRYVELSKLSHVRLIQHDKNYGRAYAVNAGLKAARADIILVLDDDMLPVGRDHLQEHYIFHQSNRDTILLGYWYFPNEVINKNLFSVYLAERNELSRQRFGERGVFGFFHTANTSFRKELCDRIGLFSEEFKSYGWEDMEWGIRASVGGAKFVLSGKIDTWHCYDPNLPGYLARMEGLGRTARILYKLQPSADVREFLHLDLTENKLFGRLLSAVFWFRIDRLLTALGASKYLPAKARNLICRSLLFAYYLKGLQT